MPPAQVFLALGANLGGRRRNLDLAVERLAAVPGIEVVAVSDWLESAPVDAPSGSGDFLNGVAELRTTLAPLGLLAVCKQIEAEAGRDLAAPHNAPRPLDLDILTYGDERIDTRELQVPHPRMFERDFVMRPLAQLTDVGSVRREETPRVLRAAAEFSAVTAAWASGGCSIGLVPTMGALHEGHASLVRMAREECDRVAVSIFVNPLQFAEGEDLEAYPRRFAADLDVLRAHGVEAVFAPPADSMYGPGFCSNVGVGAEAETMEGAARPSHFSGVATVVAKLFNLTRPTRAYFGQKDAQQVAVIRRLVADLSYPLELRIGPIVREPDGLAMSSRNVNLSGSDRAAATVLIRALRAARAAHAAGERDRDALLAAARNVIGREPAARLDYLELRHADDLSALGDGPVERGRMLVAARFGGAGARVVRLLDNLALAGEE